MIIFDLIKQIIKNQYLFKSNLSKGLLLYLENNTINTNDPIDIFLKYLRSNNITNNTVNLVASREEIFKQLLNNIEEQPVIEIIEDIVIEEKEDK